MTTLPTITFSEGADHDTIWSLLNDWVVTATLTDGSTLRGIVRWAHPFEQVQFAAAENGDVRSGISIDPDRIVTVEVA